MDVEEATPSSSCAPADPTDPGDAADLSTPQGSQMPKCFVALGAACLLSGGLYPLDTKTRRLQISPDGGKTQLASSRKLIFGGSPGALNICVS